MGLCNIVQVGRRRDGGYRYWCLTHKSNATAKYGKPASRCFGADDNDIGGEIFNLDISSYPGGIAIWGAVPPVYDTTTLPMDRGIHVHARLEPHGEKVIDRTFRRVRLRIPTDLLSYEDVEISELDAIYHMVSRVFGKEMRFIRCPLCGYPHLDRDWFSVHEHKRHLCHGCGKNFSDTVLGIGNPTISLQSLRGTNARRYPIPSPHTLNIRQEDYPGGIRIWGSNPAILWTSEKKECRGIHVHALGPDQKCVHDETYRKVVIDGVRLDADVVRFAMAQSAMPHIGGRVLSIRCPHCGKQHLDKDDLAYTPHETHECEHCWKKFKASGRTKLTIGNPMGYLKELLAKTAIRAPQEHNLNLRKETI